MTKKHVTALADALRRTQPVKGCHSGRGRGHSEACYENCYDSWQRCVNEIAWVCEQDNPSFNRERWMTYVGVR